MNSHKLFNVESVMTQSTLPCTSGKQTVTSGELHAMLAKATWKTPTQKVAFQNFINTFSKGLCQGQFIDIIYTVITSHFDTVIIHHFDTVIIHTVSLSTISLWTSKIAPGAQF